MQLRKITPEQSDKECYTSHGGLTLLGQAIRLAGLEQQLQALRKCRGISHGDIVKSYLGLLSIGKSDFEAAEGARNDDYFHAALGIGRVASAPRLPTRRGSPIPTRVMMAMA